MAVTIISVPSYQEKTLLGIFMEQVSKDPSGCWLWTGDSRKSSYGYFGRGPLSLAHRASWLLHKGGIQAGLVVRHKCDVKLCVNPDHLELGTPLQNSQDAKERGLLKPVGFALRNKLKTHCKSGHPFDKENATLGRHCSICKAAYFAEYREDNVDKIRAYDAQWKMNARRANGIGPKALKTHCNAGHELTPDNIFLREGGARRCRTCVLDRNRAAKRRYRAAKKLSLERSSSWQ